MDFAFDAIVSKEINDRVELSGFGGMIFRGSPDDVAISNGFRYGFGLGLPSRKGFRLTAELHGESYLDDSVEMNRTLTAFDGSVAPALTALDAPFNASIGLTWQSAGGVFAGAGLNYGAGCWMAIPGSRETSRTRPVGSLGFQMRLGFHPGVRIYVPPPPPPPTPTPAPAPANRPPTATARCEPCTVEIGRTSTVTCDASGIPTAIR